MACTPIQHLTLDEESKAALERIRQSKKFAKIIGVTASIGVLNSIFTKSKLPVSAFNITQTDWDLYAQTMESLPRTQKALILKEVKYMIAHYQLNGYDRKHILFWKGIRDGCK
ncbi:MAG: hypothetical protein KTR20_04615 [Cellvibrionaceae bacterium]|nr:hypothetical protein [Cellvibrionaceae bacterium]